jgi:dTDP-4-dehydrorhamnose 3,5-epimerase
LNELRFMRMEELEISGAYRIWSARMSDSRGAFVKYFDAAEFGKAGLCSAFSQIAAAENRIKGTLRGLHYQAAPSEETKVIRCAQGRIFDVLVDLRPRSPALGRWQAITLGDDPDELIYVPPGVAHGYQTLSDDCRVEYLISAAYDPGLQRGVHWRSRRLAVEWPLAVSVVSDRDEAFPEF